MVKLKRFFEGIEMPSDEELKQKYGPEGYPHQWRMAWKADQEKIKPDEDEDSENRKREMEQNRQRQEYLNKRGDDYKKIETDYSNKERNLSRIENIKVDTAAQVVDMIGNSLKVNDESFLKELKSLMAKYPQYATSIKSVGASGAPTRFINIDEPFKVHKFSQLPSSDINYKPAGDIGAQQN